MVTITNWLSQLISNHFLIFFIYFLAINCITFLVFYVDKLKAKKNQYRIQEKTLLILSVLGGTIGALLSIQTFRHKTQHKKFTIGIPIILTLQIVILILIFTL